MITSLLDSVALLSCFFRSSFMGLKRFSLWRNACEEALKLMLDFGFNV